MNKKTLLKNMGKACDIVLEKENELFNAIQFFEATNATYPICEKVEGIYNSLKNKVDKKEIEDKLREYQRSI